MRIRWLFSSLVLSLALAGTAVAAIPHLIRYQGTAVDANGVPLEGPYDLTFRLYDAATAGTVVWQEVQTAVQLTGGHFSVLLGQVTPLNVDWSVPLWLGVQVGPDPELTPRQQITSVPLSLRAELADQATQLTAPITPALITPQGAGSGLDADMVDGKQASDFINRGEAAGGDLAGTYPNPTVAKVNGRTVDFLPQTVQVVTSSGTWTRPTDVNKVRIRAWGAGGGGGGSETIAGGSGRVGSAGGDTSFGSLVIAKGGGGGSNTGTGGSAGSGGIGTINFPGGAGQASVSKTAGGDGAGSDKGDGGKGGKTTNAAGTNASGFGAGGGGGAGDGNEGSAGGGGSGEYREDIVTVTGNVIVTVGASGAKGIGNSTPSGDGGMGSPGILIVEY